MEIKNRLFPYPVLCEDTDDYIIGDFSVSVEVMKGINNITFNFLVNLNNDGIQKLINKGAAQFAIHLECSKTAYRKLLISSQKTITFQVSSTRINGDVALVGLILAKSDIPYYKNDLLNPDYKNIDMLIPKAGIIAYQNMPKVRITKNYEELNSTESFFAIVKRVKDNSDMHPIEFELTHEKVRIVVDDNIYKSYIHNSMDSNFQDLLWSLLLMPAVSFMLERLRIDGIDSYEDMEWYQKIAASYNSQGINFEDTINNKDITSVDIAQEMLRLPIGKALDNIKNEWR